MNHVKRYTQFLILLVAVAGFSLSYTQTPTTPSASKAAEARIECEIDDLSKRFSEKQLVLGRCMEGEDCKPLAGTVFQGRVLKGEITGGKVLSKPVPVYPPIARAARASGEVQVQVLIDEEGKVIGARAVSGHPLLQAAAVKASCGYRVTPTLLDGMPVKVTGAIRYNFSLKL